MTFLEASGARIVPLVMGESADTTLDKISKCSGVLLPGGADNAYYDFGKFIFETVKAYNDAGHFYPLWGTC